MNKAGVVVVIVVGLILAAVVTGTFTDILEKSEKETSKTYDDAKSSANFGKCVNTCRRKYPNSVAQFEDCKSVRC